MESGRDGQFAVVTGASSGIGFELAKVFATEGFDLLGVADEARAERLVDALGAMLRVPGNPPLPPPGRGEGRLASA